MLGAPYQKHYTFFQRQKVSWSRNPEEVVSALGTGHNSDVGGVGRQGEGCRYIWTWVNQTNKRRKGFLRVFKGLGQGASPPQSSIGGLDR